MIDTHAHLDDEQFDADRDAVVARAVAAGVEAIICVGTNLESSRAAVKLAETYPQVYAAVGIHPNSCAEAADGDWDQIAALLDKEYLVEGPLRRQEGSNIARLKEIKRLLLAI